jgi:hypothetical protein
MESPPLEKLKEVPPIYRTNPPSPVSQVSKPEFPPPQYMGPPLPPYSEDNELRPVRQQGSVVLARRQRGGSRRPSAVQGPFPQVNQRGLPHLVIGKEDHVAIEISPVPPPIGPLSVQSSRRASRAEGQSEVMQGKLDEKAEQLRELREYQAMEIRSANERNRARERGEDGPKDADGNFLYEGDAYRYDTKLGEEIKRQERNREVRERLALERINDARSPLMRFLHKLISPGVIVGIYCILATSLMILGGGKLLTTTYNPIWLIPLFIGLLMLFMPPIVFRLLQFRDANR